jgi:hypothetical protein
MTTDNLEVACFPYTLGVTSQIAIAKVPVVVQAEDKVKKKRLTIVQH